MISRRSLIAAPALILPKDLWAQQYLPPTFNLAFPGGRAPGFDPNHVAMSGGGNCRFSSVNLGGAVHTNLLTGRRPDSTSGTLAQTVFSNAPFAKFTSSTELIYSSGINLVAETAFFLAVIFYSTATTTTQTLYTYGSARANGYGIGLNATASPTLNINNSGLSTGLTYVANVPYFLVAGRFGTGTNQALILLKRLDTGQVTTATFTAATAETAPTVVHIGATSVAITGGIAAGAYIGGGAPSLAMYQAWALDPWSFWYPNRLQDLTQ